MIIVARFEGGDGMEGVVRNCLRSEEHWGSGRGCSLYGLCARALSRGFGAGVALAWHGDVGE